MDQGWRGFRQWKLAKLRLVIALGAARKRHVVVGIQKQVVALPMLARLTFIS
jgi:hypothetical protein